MDPVFTLQWTEYLAAEALAKHFPKSEDYSVLVPLSRQEKGVDLALIKKCSNGASRAVLIQVKASRAYLSQPAKRATTVRYMHHLWFNRFEPSSHSDFFLLIGLYAPDVGRTARVSTSWYRACILLFTYAEMSRFVKNCIKVGGGDDRQFGFAFDSEEKIVQTRGDKNREQTDYTNKLLANRLQLVEAALIA